MRISAFTRKLWQPRLSSFCSTLLCALLITAPTRVVACGPDFPNSLLDGGDEAVLVAPIANFQSELERLKLAPARFDFVATTNSFSEAAGDAELSDLRAALRKAGLAKSQRDDIVARHQVEREKLQEYLDAKERSGDWRPWNADESSRNSVTFSVPEIVPGLPEEFADYFRGAIAWHDPAGSREVARSHWEALLNRPADDRRYKSIWAAYMLGRAWEDEDPAKAIDYYQQVRQLAKQGFKDSLGLAAASIGWEARLQLRSNQFQRAIHLYLEQLAGGDPSAATSLRLAAARALEQPESLRGLAQDERARNVITAYLVSWRGPAWSEREPDHDVATIWLEAVEAADVRDVEAAEKFALAAYQAGQWNAAQRWIKRARNSTVADWLQVKLLLRAGKLDQATAALAAVVRRLPVAPPETNETRSASFAEELFRPGNYTYWGPRRAAQQALGELGVLRLTRREYAQALDGLLRADFWSDAAYVAERVLTVDELKIYVDRHWPPAPREYVKRHEEDDIMFISAETRQREEIRHLLGRRLTRQMRGLEAREYFPVEWQDTFDALIAQLQAGRSETDSASQRATALFAAAKIARTNGLELLGTELAPDWYIYRGNFEEGLTVELRAGTTGAKLNSASEEELRRGRTHHADPETRFHYRYQASALALEAAKLMPDDSDETAHVLFTAGSWLKHRDPDVADLFYKALVRRCSHTAIGAEADRIRWFPVLDDNGSVVRRKPRQPSEDSSAPLEDTLIAQSLEPTPSLPPNAITTEGGYDYIVHSGDSIAAILLRFHEHGTAVTAEQLFQANPSLDTGRLQVGQKLLIPAPLTSEVQPIVSAGGE